MVGQTREPICIAPRGRAGVAGIRLRPSAGRAIAGCRADEITGCFVDVEAICGSTALLRERLIEATDDRARVALLEAWLQRWIVKTPSRAVNAAVTAITSRNGIVELSGVAGAAGISLRQLERRFLEDVGLAPKMFARLVRVQSALRRVGNGDPLVDVAIACGYYDQAHMARDFDRLAETSPAAWRRYAGVLTPLFVAR
jgi:AraC-like DNA-binding protein